MFCRVFRTTVIVALLAASPAAFAQDGGASKNELGLLLGGTTTPSLTIAGGGSIRVGAGMTFQVTYARRLSETSELAWYLEFPAAAIPLQDLSAANGATPRNYDSFFVTPALRVRFRARSTVAPWLSAGGGYALFDESALRVDGTHNITRGTSSGALQFGGGVDFRPPLRLIFPIGFRAEVRDFYTGKPNYNVNTGGGLQHNVVFSGGLVVRF